jgi:AcrR family transcriptional regulator
MKRTSGPTNKYCMPLREERKDAAESRCRILEVARKLFRESDVESVSMHQIAKAAKVGQGTLYRRYAHKGELCLDLLKDSAEEFLQETGGWIADSRGKMADLDILDTVIVRIIDFTDAKLDLLAAINHAGFVSENVFYRQLHEMVSTLVESILAQNSPVALDATLATDFLLSSMSPDVYMFERETRGYTKEQIITGIRRIYFAGLLGGDA